MVENRWTRNDLPVFDLYSPVISLRFRAVPAPIGMEDSRWNFPGCLNGTPAWKFRFRPRPYGDVAGVLSGHELYCIHWIECPKSSLAITPGQISCLSAFPALRTMNVTRL